MIDVLPHRRFPPRLADARHHSAGQADARRRHRRRPLRGRRARLRHPRPRSRRRPPRPSGRARPSTAPAAGIPDLREAVARKFQANGYEGLTPEGTIVSSGAKGVLFTALQVLFEPGRRGDRADARLALVSTDGARRGREDRVRRDRPEGRLRDRSREDPGRDQCQEQGHHPELARQSHRRRAARRGAGRDRAHRGGARAPRDQRRDLRAPGVRAGDASARSRSWPRRRATSPSWSTASRRPSP